jgi:NAD(P)H-dependent FMN reductase
LKYLLNSSQAISKPIESIKFTKLKMTKQNISVAVVICTNRKPRASPQIANFVIDTINSTQKDRSSKLEPTLHLIDLEEWNLPFFDESGVPSRITDPSQYDHEHTRAWSREVSRHDAFVFVTPQYNWGYPAVLKNAIDFLYNEWKDKPAMIVSYGGHGGGKCAAQLRQVLCGVRMLPAKNAVELTFPSKGFTYQAAKGEDLGLDGTSSSGVWAADRKAISETFDELLDLCGTNKLGKLWKGTQNKVGYAKEEYREKKSKATEFKNNKTGEDEKEEQSNSRTTSQSERTPQPIEAEVGIMEAKPIESHVGPEDQRNRSDIEGQPLSKAAIRDLKKDLKKQFGKAAVHDLKKQWKTSAIESSRSLLSR